MGRALFALFIFFSLLASSLPPPATAEGGAPPGTAAASAAVHIVYMEPPPEGEDESEAFHIKTLASVLGGEEAAREALVYSYKHAACGFSARLTPEQVSQLSKQPGVLQVEPSRTMKLDTGLGRLRTMRLH